MIREAREIHCEHNGMDVFQKQILSKMLGRHQREKQTLWTNIYLHSIFITPLVAHRHLWKGESQGVRPI